MRQIQYYKYEEADAFRQIFSSWIGKFAHIGSGKIEVLARIKIRQRRKRMLEENTEPFYQVQFEFKNDLKLNADEFLKSNGLSKPALISGSNDADKKLISNGVI